MIVDRPVRRFLLTWWLCCFLLLLASVAVEQLVFSGIPGGVDVAISTLIVVGEMVRYTLVIAISGLLISTRRLFLPGLFVFLAMQFLVTEYRYSGVEGLGLYSLQLVAEGSVTIWGHLIKASFPAISLIVVLFLVAARPQGMLES
jgi:hypothetical protein